jgi:hypothetical protein
MELSKFQVVFYDNNQNELMVKWTEQFSYDDAEAYARDIIATTSWNDVSSFLINKI